MSVSGPKIIDSDLAEETYWHIMDLYDSGADIEEIRKAIPLHRSDMQDDPFEHEIYVTVYAQAFWEMGVIDDGMLDEVKHVMNAAAGVTAWSKVNGKLAKTRAKVVDNLWKKISQPNPKPRPRKKHRSVTKLYFQQDDVLVYQLSDAKFYAAICVRVLQQRGKCSYRLVRTSCTGDNKPTIDEVRRSSVWGVRIWSDEPAADTEIRQPGVSRLWPLFHPTDYFFMGLSHVSIPHKAMQAMRSRFEKIGELHIAESLNQLGSLTIAEDFAELESIHKDASPVMNEHSILYPLAELINPYPL